MRTSILLPAAAVVFTTSIQAQTVEFFYTETVDLCQYDNSSIQANEQTTHGGICAWRPDVERIYGCPAPDPTCWTWGYDCPDSTVGQTVCNRAGTVWCCNAVAGETCTTTDGQINVCISEFDSPDSGVSIDQANQDYLSAIGLSNVTATSQSADPTPFSTSSLDAAATSAAATSAAATSAAATSSDGSPSSSSTTKSASSTSSGSAATDSSASDTDPSSQSSGGSPLSAGAIAGIVVGALAAFALIGAAFLISRRRNKARNAHAYDSAPSTASNMAETGGAQGFYEPTKSPNGGQYESSELGDTPARVEMPASYANTQKPDFRPHELP